MSDMAMAELLRTALHTLEADQEGHLHLQSRRQIRGTFGEIVGADEDEGPSDAVRALVVLDRMTVEHVMHHWNRVLPDDDRPHRMLELADALLNDTVDQEAVMHERDRFWSFVEGMPDLGDEGRALAVGMAAVRTVSTARGTDADDEDLSPDEDDGDLDPYMWGCPYFASLAEAPGVANSPEGVEARRTFWRWWLTEAVPQVARDAGLDVD